MSETPNEMFARVQQMVCDDGSTWDLSDNDKAALSYLLDQCSTGANPARDELIRRAEAAEAALVAVRQERDTWRRVAERLEREKVAAEQREAEKDREIATVLKAFDDGIFCRNVGGDHASGWAMRLMGPLSALARLQQAALASPSTPSPLEAKCNWCEDAAVRIGLTGQTAIAACAGHAHLLSSTPSPAPSAAEEPR